MVLFITATDMARISDTARWEKVREYRITNRWRRATVLTLGITSAFVGLVLIGIPGVIASLLTTLLGDRLGQGTSERVREIERGGSD